MNTFNLSKMEKEYLRYFPEAETGEDFCVSEDCSLDLVTTPLNGLSLRAGSDKQAQSSISRTFDLGDQIIHIISDLDKGENWIVIAFKLPHQ